jgi:GNAT superfamily N-acetyltransferase
VTTVPAIVRRLAEEPEVFVTDTPPPTRRIVTPSYRLTLSPSPTQTLVSAVRTTPDKLDALIGEIRGTLRELKYSGCVWSVGPSSEPHGLSAMLAARGFVPATRPPYETEQAAMALASAPPPPRPGVEARQVRDFEEYKLALNICLDAFGEDEEAKAAWMAAAPNLWQLGESAKLTHLAFVDGKPLGFAFAVPTRAGVVLGGGGVLPSARGRGAYRALIAARWELAVRLGTPALVIQAGAMSRPIVERCGFETICRLEVFDDSVIWNEGAAGRAA